MIRKSLLGILFGIFGMAFIHNHSLVAQDVVFIDASSAFDQIRKNQLQSPVAPTGTVGKYVQPSRPGEVPLVTKAQIDQFVRVSENTAVSGAVSGAAALPVSSDQPSTISASILPGTYLSRVWPPNYVQPRTLPEEATKWNRTEYEKIPVLRQGVQHLEKRTIIPTDQTLNHLVPYP